MWFGGGGGRSLEYSWGFGLGVFLVFSFFFLFYGVYGCSELGGGFFFIGVYRGS